MGGVGPGQTGESIGDGEGLHISDIMGNVNGDKEINSVANGTGIGLRERVVAVIGEANLINGGLLVHQGQG